MLSRRLGHWVCFLLLFICSTCVGQPMWVLWVAFSCASKRGTAQDKNLLLWIGIGRHISTPGKRKNEMGQRDFPILRHTHLLEKCTHPGQGLVTGYSHFQLYSAEQSEAEVLGSCNL